LIDEAIAESPRVATRYLFARGILELELNRLDQLQNTAAEIRALALPPDDSDRTEDKAVSYLLGMSAFRQDDHATAGTELVSAVSENGYEYAVYAIGLARLHLATGNLDDAAALADGAMSARDPGDLRLDLELDRARAMLLHAEILARMGSVAEAREQSRRFVERWQSANAFSPDLLRARQLLSAE
jgi:hypothetical protein